MYNDTGKTHDFRMFRESMVGVLPERLIILGDCAFVGIHEYFPGAIIPYKATKNKPLTKEQKEINTLISKVRVKVEHVIRELKIFRICKETYRGNSESGLRRVQLIASIVNLNRFS